MKEKIRNLVNNTYIVHALMILSMTQVFSFMKAFQMEMYINDGSMSEFLMILGTIAVSVLSLVCFLCLITLEKNQSGLNLNTSDWVHNVFYIGLSGILIWILYGIVGGDPFVTIFSITAHTDNIYNIVFNKTLYMIDIVLILAIYASRKLYKLWDFLLKILVFKTCFMIGIYISIIAIVNLFNAGQMRSTNSYIPANIFCHGTYVETTNLFFFKNVDCPFKDSKNADIDYAISGSTLAYNKAMNTPLDLKEKAEITLKFYAANSIYDKKTWLEEHYPNIYLGSLTQTSKSYYQLNKASDVMLAKLIVDGKMDVALEKAKEVIASNNKMKIDDLNRPRNTIAYVIVKNAENAK